MGFGLTLQRFIEHLITDPFVALQSLTHSIKDIVEIFFFYFTELSLTACYVIPVVIVIRFLLRNKPKTYSYALWGIVYFKLVSVFKLDFLNYSLIPQYQIDKIYTTITPNITSFYSEAAGIVSQVQSEFTMPVPVVTPVYTPALIWFAVLSVIITISVIMFFSLYFETRSNSTQCLVDNIYTSDSIPAPFVFGIIHPKIYLPKGITETQRNYIITHENVHIKRGDHIIKLVAFAITCIHWFNPLVWLSFFLMEKDMEMSCDEKVIGLLGNEHKKDYSYCILLLASDKKFLPKAYLSFGDSDTKKRVKNVLNYKKPRFWMGVLTVVLLLFLTLGMISDSNIVAGPDNHINNKTEIDYTRVELLADIYLCDSVYRTDYTLTYGNGSITLPVRQEYLEVKDYRLFLCTDGCDISAIVSRASQGYAPAYQVVTDYEIFGNFHAYKFEMKMSELMVEDLKNQGIYEDMVKQVENNHYYLIAIDENHYAYIHLEGKTADEEMKNGTELADYSIMNAEINISTV